MSAENPGDMEYGLPFFAGEESPGDCEYGIFFFVGGTAVVGVISIFVSDTVNVTEANIELYIGFLPLDISVSDSISVTDFVDASIQTILLKVKTASPVRWKQGKAYTKVAGSWVECKVYVKVSGTWETVND